MRRRGPTDAKHDLAARCGRPARRPVRPRQRKEESSCLTVQAVVVEEVELVAVTREMGDNRVKGSCPASVTQAASGASPARRSAAPVASCQRVSGNRSGSGGDGPTATRSVGHRGYGRPGHGDDRSAVALLDPTDAARPSVRLIPERHLTDRIATDRRDRQGGVPLPGGTFPRCAPSLSSRQGNVLDDTGQT